MSDKTPDDHEEPQDSQDASTGSDQESGSDKKPDTKPDLPPIPEEALKPVKDQDEEDAVEAEVTVEAEIVSEPVTDIPNVMDLKGDPEYTIIGGDGDEYGPRTMEDVHRWIRGGRADGSTLVREGSKGPWVPLNQIPRLAALLEGHAPQVRRPSKATAIAIFTLVGGMISMAWVLVVGWAIFASFGLACCLIPGGLYSFIAGIFVTVRGFQLLGKNSVQILDRTGTAASLLIGGILAANFITLGLGIVIHVLLRSQEVEEYLEANRSKNT